MACISFDGFNKIRNKIEPSLKLHINLRPSVIYTITQLDQIVVHHNKSNRQNNNDNNKNNKNYFHIASLNLSVSSALSTATCSLDVLARCLSNSTCIS